MTEHDPTITRAERSELSGEMPETLRAVRRDGGRVTPGEIADEVDLATHTIADHLRTLYREEYLDRRPQLGQGGYLYWDADAEPEPEVPTAHDELVTDGGTERIEGYEAGDVVLDLAQGRPMQVVDVPAQSVAEWSDANGYDLMENYGNQRLGVDPHDLVVECVYCSDISGEPSRTYTFPESRVTRVRVEAATDDERRIQDHIRIGLLDRLLQVADRRDGVDRDALEELASVALPDDLVDVAAELAEARQIGATDGGDDV